MTDHIGLLSVAIADPTRRAVIKRLVDGTASVSELAEPHAMALPSFLKHLGRLERAGLGRTIESGRPRMVHIDPAPVGLAEGWLARQRRLWEGCTDRLALLAEALERGTPRPPDPQGPPP